MAQAGDANGVNALNAGEGVLGFFWDLASLDQDARVRAATALVDEILKSQQEHDAESGEEEEDEEGAAGQGQGAEVARALRRCTPLVVYAVKRLCRGLGSGRQGARQGFALGLTTLLARCDCLSAEEAVTVLTGVLEASGSKGSDLRETLLGHVFGYAAVVRSGKPLSSATVAHIAAGLVSTAERKSFMRESATAVLLELLEGLDAAALAAVLSDVPALEAWLVAPAEEASPEALLLAVRLWARLPAAAVAACPLLPAGCKPPPADTFTRPSAAHRKAAAPAAAAFFCAGHLQKLLPVLCSSTHSHPRLHTVWPTLMALLLPGFTPEREQQQQQQGEPGKHGHPGAAELSALWGVVVEGDLFTHHSHERKYLGFTLFGILLPNLSPEHVAMVFTPAFLRCLSNNLSKPDSYLHAAAKKCLDRISAFSSKADPTVRLAVAVALQRHGGAAFDRITKVTGKAGAGKLMLEGLEGEGLETYVHKLQATFTDTAAASGEAGQEAEAEAEAEEGGGRQQLQWSVEQMCGVLKQATTPAALKVEVLQFLALHAFFSVGAAAAKKGRDAQLKAAARCSGLGRAVRQLCASRLIVQADALAKPAPHPQGGKKQQRQQPDGEGAAAPEEQQQQQQAQHDYLGDVVAYISKLLAAPAVEIAAEGGEAVEPVVAGLQALRARIAGLLKKAGAGGADGRLRALHHLVCLLELQLLADPESVDPAAVEDLGAVVGGAFEGAAPPAAVDEGEAPPPHWMDTLVDLLLSLLARPAEGLPSAPLRDASERVFRVFAEELTATGMEDLLRIVAKSEEGKAGDGDDIYASEEDEEEEGGAESGEEGGDGDGSDASDADSDGGGSDDEAAAASGSDAEADGDDALSDAAMFRMDSKLAAYFSTIKDNRGGAKARREGLLNFKMRVLSLLEAYAKKVPASPLLPATLQPLLTALALASKPGAPTNLAERLAGLILNRICKSKAEASGAAGVSDEVLSTQLRRALYLASRATERRVASAAVAAYVYLQRVAAGGAGPGASSLGLESAQAALADFFGKKKTRLSRPFFEEVGRRVPSLGAALLPEMLQQAVAARNEYLRTEAVAMVGALLRSADGRLGEAMAGSKAAVKPLLHAAVSGESYPKQQRQAEALKVSCQLVEAVEARAGGVGAYLGAEGKKSLQAAVDAALAGAAGKVEGQLRRLHGLLQQKPAGAGKAAAKGAAPAAGSQKRKAAEQKQGPAAKQQAKKPKAAAPKS